MLGARRSSALTRRSVLAAGLATPAAVGVAGCSSRPSGSGAGDAPATAQLDTDQQIVVDVVGRLNTSLGLLRQVRTAHPALAVVPLVALLQAHRETLRGASSQLPRARPSTVAPAATRDAALTQVRQDAATLQQAVLDAAERAESGTFARLLASMGCGLAQRLAVLGPPA